MSEIERAFINNRYINTAHTIFNPQHKFKVGDRVRWIKMLSRDKKCPELCKLFKDLKNKDLIIEECINNDMYKIKGHHLIWEEEELSRAKIIDWKKEFK